MSRGTLSFPDAERQNLARLTHLSSDQVRAFAKGLDGEDPSYSKLLAVFDGDESLFSALLGLTVFRTSQAIRAEEMTATLREALGADAGEADLTDLFRARALVLLAKSLDHESAYPTILQSSRILTDVRPIFLDDGTAPAIASQIHHTVVLTVTRRGRVEEMFLDMDTEDLVELTRHIERALDKQQALHRQLSRAEMPIVSEGS